LAGIVLVAALLRCWALDRNGFGNEYYSAGVRSMIAGWRNFFFNAFDPAGFVSLDKPPVAFWIQAASAKLFGFRALSLLLPQVVEGLAAILVLHHLVARRFGAAAGLLAAAFLALTPVSVAVDRSTNTESCLVLVLLLAAWALSLAGERGSGRHLALAMALLGVGFNVKMLAALVVAPGFLLVYLLGAPIALRQRLRHAVLGLAVLGAVALSWSAVYDLTPSESRPFAGSSHGNSMIELAFDHNGLQRFIHRGRQALAARLDDGAATAPAPGAAADPAATDPAAPPDGAAAQPLGQRNRPENVPAGPLRLAAPFLAGQIGWLLPLALIGLLAMAPRRRPRLPLSPRGQALLLWGGWALSYGVLFSAAAGIFHAYYLATMAPPLAALAAIAALHLWQRYRADQRWALALPGALLATAWWQRYIAVGEPGAAQLEWWPWLFLAAITGTAVAVGLLLAGATPLRRFAPAGFALGLAAALTLPAAWALSSVAVPGHVEFPAAGLWQPGPGEAPAVQRARLRQIDELLAFLHENHHGERFLVATPDARRAAPLIIASGAPVMAMGGYMGADAILTPDALARMAAAHDVRFVMIVPEDERAQRAGRNIALSQWVRANGRLVDPSLWRAMPVAGGDAPLTPWRRSLRRSPRSLAALELYDLAPESAATASDATQ
jgi:4-amino-4-deoxy-L-arabinose transferase-like glycosyltransferase